MILDFIKKFDHRFFFPYLAEEKGEQYFVKKDILKYPLDDSIMQNMPTNLQDYFRNCTLNWRLDEFHFKYTDGCVIEPNAGWGITLDNKVIPQSIWNYYIHKVNKPYYLRYRLFPTKKINLPSAISLQYAWMNYWHFYNDILGQLKLADDAGLPFDTPIIVPAGIRDMNYFNAFMSLSPNLKNRNWIFQDKSTQVHCREAHFFNTFWNHRKNFDGVLNYIDFNHERKLLNPGNNRVFISRKKIRGRNIVNIEAVTKVLSKYEFKFIDCEDLTISEQIDVFQNAGCIIGIHGAGLTNIIYRRNNPLKLLEIFSSNYFNPCYFWLCQQYNYDYFGLVGSESDNTKTTTGNFSINIEDFERKIKSMLDC